MTITIIMTPDDFPLTYDPSTKVIRGTQSDNTIFGPHTLQISVNDVWNIGTLTTELNFTMNQNVSPIVVHIPPSPACVASHTLLNYSIPLTYFSDPDSEPILFSYTTNDTSGNDSWLSMSSDAVNLTFTGMPLNINNGTYKITLTLSDGHPDTADVTTQFNI